MFSGRSSREFQSGFLADDARRQRGSNRLNLRKQERQHQRNKRRKHVNLIKAQSSSNNNNDFLIEMSIGNKENKSTHHVYFDKVCKYCDNIVYFAINLNNNNDNNNNGSKSLKSSSNIHENIDPDTWIHNRSIPWNLLFSIRALRIMFCNNNINSTSMLWDIIMNHSYDNKSVTKVLIELIRYFSRHCDKNGNDIKNSKLLNYSDVKWVANNVSLFAYECVWVLVNICSWDPNDGKSNNIDINIINKKQNQYNEYLKHLCEKENIIDALINIIKSTNNFELVTCGLWCIGNICGESQFIELAIKRGILDVLVDCNRLLVGINRVNMNDMKQMSDTAELINTIFFLTSNLFIDRIETQKSKNGQTVLSSKVKLEQVVQLCELCHDYLPLIFNIYEEYLKQNYLLQKFQIEYQRKFELNYKQQQNGCNISNIQQQHEITQLCMEKMKPELNNIKNNWKCPEILFETWINSLSDLLLVIDCIVFYLNDAMGPLLSYFIDDEDKKRHGFLRYIIKLLSSDLPKLLKPCCRIVGNLCSAEDETGTQVVLEYGILDKIDKVLNCNFKFARKEMVWTISNIIAGTEDQIKELIEYKNGEIISKIVELGEKDLAMIRGECVHVIANAASNASIEHCHRIIELNGLSTLIDVLDRYSLDSLHVNKQSLQVALEAINAFLQSESLVDDIKQRLEISGALSKLNEIIASTQLNNDIIEIAEKIIDRIANASDEEEMAPSFLNQQQQNNNNDNGNNSFGNGQNQQNNQNNNQNVFGFGNGSTGMNNEGNMEPQVDKNTNHFGFGFRTSLMGENRDRVISALNGISNMNRNFGINNNGIDRMNDENRNYGNISNINKFGGCGGSSIQYSTHKVFENVTQRHNNYVSTTQTAHQFKYCF